MRFPATLVRPVLGALLIIGLSGLLAWMTPAWITPALAQRLFGALLGAVVVVYANAIPKALAASVRGCAAGTQAGRRFAGWVLVLGGLGYMLASLFAPIALARPVAGAVLGVALLLALARCLRKAPTTSVF